MHRSLKVVYLKRVLKNIFHLAIFALALICVFYAGAYNEWKSNQISTSEFLEVNESYHTKIVWFEETQGGESENGLSKINFVDYIDNGTEKRLFADDNNTVTPIQTNAMNEKLVHVGESKDGKNFWIVYIPSKETYLNNKDTGVKAKNATNFGPMTANSVVYGIASVSGQKLRSNDYILKNGDDYIKLDFTESQNSMQIDQYKMRNLIYWYTYYFTQAVNTGDFEDVEDYLYPGSSLYNAQKSYVASTYEKGIKENIKSFNVISYSLSDDKKSGTVSTEEDYDIYQNSDTEPSTKTFHYTYTFTYNDEFSGYQLSGIN